MNEKIKAITKLNSKMKDKSISFGNIFKGLMYKNYTLNKEHSPATK